MKSRYHLIKNKVLVQSTDGSIFRTKMFSKISVFKLNSDTKSHILWKYIDNLETLVDKRELPNINFIKKFWIK